MCVFPTLTQDPQKTTHNTTHGFRLQSVFRLRHVKLLI